MRPIVDTSHFWMSDHSRFWYHLVGHEMVNLGAILITDTGKMIFGVKIQIPLLFLQCTLFENISKCRI